MEIEMNLPDVTITKRLIPASLLGTGDRITVFGPIRGTLLERSDHGIRVRISTNRGPAVVDTNWHCAVGYVVPDSDRIAQLG
jgi:hypothetical protein